MSAPDTTPAPRKRSVIPKVIVGVAFSILVLIALGLAATRYGVLLPQARLMIEARTDGLKVGRLGRLKIEGLSGDIWRDLTVRRVTLRDEKGIWLEANNLHMSWRYSELLRRRFHADRIDVQLLRVLRRPTLTPKGKDTGLPVSFLIDDAHGRVELLPEFSYRRGLYDLDLNLKVERAGDINGKVRAASVLRQGDHLNVDFDLGKVRPFKVLADAVEAQGGALAGALGLPADRPFSLQVVAGGKSAEGKLTAVALSGNTEPLRAVGAWNGQGGSAYGRLSLKASTLTAPYAARLGPEARFAVGGRKAAGDLVAIDARIMAENLTARGRGLVDVGKRRIAPKGVAIEAGTAALARLAGGPATGPARITGTLVELTPGWRFAGQAEASKLTVGSYSLARAAGPLEVTRKGGDWGVKTQLVGSGGSGTGFVAAALGAAPRANFDGSRLADGRLAMRELVLTGAGVKVEASGGRSLLGGLNFKGNATISNLAAARPGAAGSASATWSATQSRAGQPWTLSADARGERFATGYAEIDRLLGQQPQIKALANVQGRRVSVGSASLQGAALKASTAGVLGEDGALSFKLDWSASGPFRAGPVEITGNAKGSGAVTGTLGAPRADLLADVDAIDLPRMPLKAAHVTLSFLRKPDGSSGMVAMTATSSYGPARGRSDFRFPEGGVDLSGLSVDAGGVKASGSLSLRRSAPSAADLDLVITKGALLDGGRIAGAVKIVDAAGGPRASLSLTAENARMVGSTIGVKSARLTADGPLSRLPYALQADGATATDRWSLNGRGLLSETQPGYAATFDGMGKLGGRDLHTVETATFHFGGPEQSARLRLAASDGGRIDLDGKLSDAGADVRAQVAGLGLGVLDEDLAGRLDATLALKGQGDRLDGAFEAKLAGARGRGAPVASGLDGVVRGRLADNTLNIDMNTANALGLKANANLVLPTEASAAPFRIAIARKQPLHGRFEAQGEVRPLWDLLVGGERSLSGMVQTQGTLGGTLADPTASGQIAVSAGRFDDGGTGLSLRDVVLKAAFTNGGVDVTEARGVDGHGGSVSGQGRMSLMREGVSSFKLDLKGFRLIDNDQGSASASGQATVDRAADGKVRLTGALTIDRADIAPKLPTPSGVVPMDVIEINRPIEMVDRQQVQRRRGDGWALDVTLNAPRRIFLRGRGLDVELSLDAHVTGTTTHPNLSGTARVVRGDYDFAGKRFEFDSQSVVFLSTRPEQIRLDLTATRDDPTLTASVRIRGTAARPEITLTSTPSLPNDEVLSQVLFGRSASQLSPIEAAQLASAISSLAGGGGFDVIGNLRNFAGLDRLTFGGGDASGVTVSGGKYLTDNVYLEITGGGRAGPSAQVEWRVRRTLAIISQIGGQGDSRLAVRWRRDY